MSQGGVQWQASVIVMLNLKVLLTVLGLCAVRKMSTDL
jgi:hypothetical protein